MKNTKTINENLKYYNTTVKVMFYPDDRKQQLKVDLLTIAETINDANELGKTFIKKMIDVDKKMREVKIVSIIARSLLSSIKVIVDKSMVENEKEG